MTHEPSSESIPSEEELLRAVVNTLPDLIFIKDTEGRFMFANPAYAQLVGAASPGEMLGKTASDYFQPLLAAIYHEGDLGVMRSGKPLLGHEQPIVTRDSGSEIWVSVNKVPLRDKAGAVTGLISLGRDITKRRKAEIERDAHQEELSAAFVELEKAHTELKHTQSALIQAEKLESMGRLAAGIAHEVKNPLSHVILSMDYLNVALKPQGGPVGEVVDIITGAASRIDRIVTEMLDFSTPREMGMHPCQLHDIIEKTLRLVKVELLKERIVVERNLEQDLPPIIADHNRLEQVLLNLVINAIHAMAGGGTLSITTRSLHFTSSEREIGQKHGWFRAGDQAVVLEISDTGHGIPEDKLNKIFDPFFTTKETGKGTGLGLTVVKKILDMHQARLMISNCPEGGVTASITIKAAMPQQPLTTDETG